MNALMMSAGPSWPGMANGGTFACPPFTGTKARFYGDGVSQEPIGRTALETFSQVISGTDSECVLAGFFNIDKKHRDE